MKCVPAVFPTSPTSLRNAFTGSGDSSWVRHKAYSVQIRLVASFLCFHSWLEPLSSWIKLQVLCPGAPWCFFTVFIPSSSISYAVHWPPTATWWLLPQPWHPGPWPKPPLMWVSLWLERLLFRVCWFSAGVCLLSGTICKSPPLLSLSIVSWFAS